MFVAIQRNTGLCDLGIGESYSRIFIKFIDFGNPTTKLINHCSRLIKNEKNCYIPYFAAGGGFALFNAPGTYLNGMTFFGAFGLDYKLDRLMKSNRMTMGVFVRYNSLLFESKDLFAPGDDFRFHQMITSAFNISIYF